MNLENDLRDELSRARVAREVRGPLLEVGIRRQQENAGRGLAGLVDGVDKPSRVLGVVEDIAEVATEFEVPGVFTLEGKLFAERKVEVVNPRHADGIASHVGQGARSGRDIPGVRDG